MESIKKLMAAILSLFFNLLDRLTHPKEWFVIYLLCGNGKDTTGHSWTLKFKYRWNIDVIRDLQIKLKTKNKPYYWLYCFKFDVDIPSTFFRPQK